MKNNDKRKNLLEAASEGRKRGNYIGGSGYTISSVSDSIVKIIGGDDNSTVFLTLTFPLVN